MFEHGGMGPSGAADRAFISRRSSARRYLSTAAEDFGQGAQRGTPSSP